MPTADSKRTHERKANPDRTVERAHQASSERIALGRQPIVARFRVAIDAQYQVRWAIANGDAKATETGHDERSSKGRGADERREPNRRLDGKVLRS